MTIWHMRIACWIPKATDTHSGCVTPYCFSTATMVARRASLTFTLHGLSCYDKNSCVLSALFIEQFSYFVFAFWENSTRNVIALQNCFYPATNDLWHKSLCNGHWWPCMLKGLTFRLRVWSWGECSAYGSPTHSDDETLHYGANP